MKIYQKSKNLKKLSNRYFKNNLFKFYKIYQKRPIKNNSGGMMFNKMFAFYYLLKKINPKFVIESGVYKGQTTWLIEKILPNSKILSIDIDLTKRVHISKKIKYSSVDFKYHNFSNLPPNTLAFFDDHQNHVNRLMECKRAGIKNIIFEDNYSAGRGDFYTLRHAFNFKGYYHPLTFKNILKSSFIFLSMIIKKKILKNYYISFDLLRSRLRDVAPNKKDYEFLRKNVDLYYEFPPLFETSSKKKVSKSMKINSLFQAKNIKYFDLSENEIDYFNTATNSLTFVKLK